MRASTSKATLVTFFAALAVVTTALSETPAQSAGNSMQEGCMNQWLFNGVLRVRVTKVEPFMDGTQQVGWQITESWRNGTSREIAPGDSLLKVQVLDLEDGSSMPASETIPV